MSLFKSKEYWAVDGLDGEFGPGCLAVLPNQATSESDRLVVGNYSGYIRVFDPQQGIETTDSDGVPYRPEQLLVEQRLDYPVLQVACGLLSSGSTEESIAVLHPRKLVVYSISGNTGKIEHGNQYGLRKMYEHLLERSAYCMEVGPFGGVNGKDFICVLSLDGMLSFYEMENFTFSRLLPECLLPSPIVFVPGTDSFATSTSAGSVCSYKYQVLAAASDQTKEGSRSSGGKKINAEWSFRTGESILFMHTTQATEDGSCVLAIGSRSIYCFSQSGNLRFAKKLNMSICASHYYRTTTEGWIMFMLSTANNTLLLYCETTLKWAAGLPFKAVDLKTVQINNTQGLVAAISETGSLQCLYMGTDPAMYGVPRAAQRHIDYEDGLKEMQDLSQAVADGTVDICRF